MCLRLLKMPVVVPIGQFALHKTHFLSTFKAIQELYVALLVVPLSRLSIIAFDVGMFTLDYLTSYGHITLDIPDPIRTLKSSRVEPT